MRRLRRRLYERRLKQINMLISCGVSVDICDKKGQTPPLAMVRYLNILDDDSYIGKLVELLLKVGANVNCRGRLDDTPLHEAVSQGLISTTKRLLEYGANVNARKADGTGVIRLGMNTARDKGRGPHVLQLRKGHRELHIRIMTCINLVRERGGVECPSVYDEWSISKHSSQSSH